MTERALRVGDQVRDNDPRMNRRMLIVRRIWWPTSGNRDEAKAILNDAIGRPFSVLLRRIYTDGKARRTGFSLWPLEAPADSRSEGPSLLPVDPGQDEQGKGESQ